MKQTTPNTNETNKNPLELSRPLILGFTQESVTDGSTASGFPTGQYRPHGSFFRSMSD